MKNKNFIVTIFLILLLNGLALGGWLYFIFTIKEQNRAVKEERQKLAINEKTFQNANSLKALMSEVAEKKQLIDSFFLNRESAINFIENLELIAKQTDVSIKIGNVSIKNTEKEILNLQFNLSGDFKQVFHYLVLLENLPYLIDVERINFRKAGEKWQADFEISLSGFKET